MNGSLVVVLLMSGIFYGTPLLIAGMGELLAERAGVLNLGVEGMMLVGAVCAFWVSNSVGGPSVLALVLALVAAASAGTAMSLIHAFVCVTLRANQIVSGLALSIFGGALGLSNLIGDVGKLPGQPGKHAIGALNVFGLKDLPVIGPLVFNQTSLVYLSWLLVGVVAYYLQRTRTGLNLRAVGESPRSSDVMGVPVNLYRYVHTLIGGALAGVAGGSYTLMIAPSWSNGMTAGAGWIAVALVIFSRWSPKVIPLGAYLFGTVTGLGYVLQARGVEIPTEIFSAAPYVMTMIALVALSCTSTAARNDGPAALGVPYFREES